MWRGRLLRPTDRQIDVLALAERVAVAVRHVLELHESYVGRQLTACITIQQRLLHVAYTEVGGAVHKQPQPSDVPLRMVSTMRLSELCGGRTGCAATNSASSVWYASQLCL